MGKSWIIMGISWEYHGKIMGNHGKIMEKYSWMNKSEEILDLAILGVFPMENSCCSPRFLAPR